MGQKPVAGAFSFCRVGSARVINAAASEAAQCGFEQLAKEQT
jgi:hypothetical protein